MSNKPINPDDALAGPMYAIAAILVALPILDYVQSVGVPQLRNIQWRFASVGLLSGVLLTPLLGLALAIVVSAFRENVVLARVLSLLALIAALLLVLVSGAFLLDTLQLRNVIPTPNRGGFLVAAIKALAKNLIAALVLVYLGVRGLRVSSWRSPKATMPVGIVAK